MSRSTPTPKKPRFSSRKVKEHPMTEGRTYLARVLVDPWKGWAGHKRSLVGQIVKVRLGDAVEIEWPSGGGNSFARSSVEVIGEAES